METLEASRFFLVHWKRCIQVLLTFFFFKNLIFCVFQIPCLLLSVLLQSVPAKVLSAGWRHCSLEMEQSSYFFPSISILSAVMPQVVWQSSGDGSQSRKQKTGQSSTSPTFPKNASTSFQCDSPGQCLLPIPSSLLM